jgi:hypothetical protein
VCDKWPWTDKCHKLNPSKTRLDDLKAALLNPKFGFTTTSPSAIVDDGTADADKGVGHASHIEVESSPAVCCMHAFLVLPFNN